MALILSLYKRVTNGNNENDKNTYCQWHAFHVLHLRHWHRGTGLRVFILGNEYLYGWVASRLFGNIYLSLAQEGILSAFGLKYYNASFSAIVPTSGWRRLHFGYLHLTRCISPPSASLVEDADGDEFPVLYPIHGISVLSYLKRRWFGITTFVIFY